MLRGVTLSNLFANVLQTEGKAVGRFFCIKLTDKDNEVHVGVRVHGRVLKMYIFSDLLQIIVAHLLLLRWTFLLFLYKCTGIKVRRSHFVLDGLYSGHLLESCLVLSMVEATACVEPYFNQRSHTPNLILKSGWMSC